MRVAFQGEPGAYSEQAVFNYYEEVDTLPCESFDVMFDSVVAGKSDLALVPIENSLAGSIHQNYDLLLRHDLHIVGEYLLRVHHCLISMPGVKMGEIKKAISHPQALGQCAGYLRSHGIKAEQVYDTAGSVKMLKESGSLAVGREAVVPAGEAKTSIVFTLKNMPGALFKALSVFALRDIDLTKIESRPLQGKPWEYLFYIDFVGSTSDDVSKRALDHLGEYAMTLRVLGSYPRFKG